MPRKIITIGIVDDMLLDQALITYYTKAVKNTTILFRVGNGKELLFKLSHFKPDMLIVDLNMPIMDGWATLKELENIGFKGKIICTSGGRELNLQQRLMEAGAHGFAPKHIPSLSKTIEQVIKGINHFDTDYIEINFCCKQEEVEIDGREVAIINGLSQGKASKLIADDIGGITEQTVDSYISNMLSKFNRKNRAHLVSMGYNYGLIYTFENENNLPKPKPKPKPTETETDLGIAI